MTKQNTSDNIGLIHVGLVYDRTKGYAEHISCTNCNWFDTIYIPYGIKRKEYLKDKICERCKCKETLY